MQRKYRIHNAKKVQKVQQKNCTFWVTGTPPLIFQTAFGWVNKLQTLKSNIQFCVTACSCDDLTNKAINSKISKTKLNTTNKYISSCKYEKVTDCTLCEKLGKQSQTVS